MTEIDISTVLIEGDTATIMGVKYQRVEEPQSFYNKLCGLIKTELDDTADTNEMADKVMDLIKRHFPLSCKNLYMSEYLLGYNEAIKQLEGNFE
jgi:hypothetical protein